MKNTLLALVVAATLPIAALAQTPAAPMRGGAAPPKVAKAAKAGAGVSAIGDVWKMMTDYVTAAAEEMPDSAYAFKATPEVRSFGQLIGHIAGAQHMMCAAALGEKAGAEDDIEKTKTTKAELVPALKESTAYCARAYAQTDASAARMTKFFGQDKTRFFALALNSAHNGEHYGNIVTYFRLKGMVPPSSRPQK